MTKNREKKIIFGSKWSEANNEPTFRLYQQKNFSSELSEANNEPIFRIQKIDKKSREKIEKLFLGQNYLKRIMS